MEIVKLLHNSKIAEMVISRVEGLPPRRKQRIIIEDLKRLIKLIKIKSLQTRNKKMKLLFLRMTNKDE